MSTWGISRMTWADAMERYGSDKPDLRIDWELVSIDDLMSEVDFKVFSGPAQDPGSRVRAQGAGWCFAVTQRNRRLHQLCGRLWCERGLAWIKVNDRAAGIEGLQSPIIKFMPDDTVLAMLDEA